MATHAVVVLAAASNGAASAGNSAAANVLVVVTDLASGVGVTTLTQADFEIVDQFALPGQVCGFSSNITLFHSVGTGAYQIQLAPHSTTPPPGGCKWTAGTYLGQIIVKSAAVAGQAVFTLSIP